MNDAQQNVEGWYGELGPQLLTYFGRRHGDRGQAEDLLQETFAEALRHPGRVEQAVSPRAYLFGIARNLSREAYRRARRQAGLDAAAEAMPAAPLETSARLELMHEAIAELPDHLREVLELRLQQDLSYEEIAAALQIPVGTVRSRLHHAVARLRERLANEPDI